LNANLKPVLFGMGGCHARWLARGQAQLPVMGQCCWHQIRDCACL